VTGCTANGSNSANSSEKIMEVDIMSLLLLALCVFCVLDKVCYKREGLFSDSRRTIGAVSEYGCTVSEYDCPVSEYGCTVSEPDHAASTRTNVASKPRLFNQKEERMKVRTIAGMVFIFSVEQLTNNNILRVLDLENKLCQQVMTL